MLDRDLAELYREGISYFKFRISNLAEGLGRRADGRPVDSIAFIDAWNDDHSGDFDSVEGLSLAKEFLQGQEESL